MCVIEAFVTLLLEATWPSKEIQLYDRDINYEAFYIVVWNKQ